MYGFGWLSEYFETRKQNKLFKQRSYEKYTIAIKANYTTTYVGDEGKPTGEPNSVHHLLFCQDGNGKRYTRVESTQKYPPMDVHHHSHMLRDHLNWIHFNIYPAESVVTSNAAKVPTKDISEKPTVSKKSVLAIKNNLKLLAGGKMKETVDINLKV